ncbi:MAG: ABC transporter ATP-binding protein, partial [Desulfobacterales bacterium]|nr:ABC transporter ATP-binding protein [Desulfobacterales bacterium]
IMMVKSLFRELAGQGVTIFMSTHTLKVAEDICDRIGVINKGRLIAMGTTRELQREANITETDLERVFFNLTSETPYPQN